MLPCMPTTGSRLPTYFFNSAESIICTLKELRSEYSGMPIGISCIDVEKKMAKGLYKKVKVQPDARLQGEHVHFWSCHSPWSSCLLRHTLHNADVLALPQPPELSSTPLLVTFTMQAGSWLLLDR